MSTFADTLAQRLRDDPGQPLVTFYDHATDERVELSVATYANWVAKAGSLLVDELDLERGETLRIDLPPHWLGTVFLGAAWSAGLVVTDADDPTAVVCGPDTLATWAAQSDQRVVLACSLLPLGVRFAEPVPAGVHDIGVEIWSQPDSFIPWDPPGPADPALRGPGGEITQSQLGELGQATAAGPVVADAGRLLSVANPVSEPAILTEPLHHGGSLVLVAQAERGRLDETYAAERATARFPT